MRLGEETLEKGGREAIKKGFGFWSSPTHGIVMEKVGDREGRHTIVSAALRKELPWPGTSPPEPPCDGDMKGEERRRGRKGNYWNSR